MTSEVNDAFHRLRRHHGIDHRLFSGLHNSQEKRVLVGKHCELADAFRTRSSRIGG